MITEGTEKVCSLLTFQAGRSKQICNRSHLAPSRLHLLSLVSMNRAVEVHSLGDSTVIFVLCNSVRVDADVNDKSSFETEDVFQDELFFTLGKVLAMQIVWNTTRHHIHVSSSFKRFSRIFLPEM